MQVWVFVVVLACGVAALESPREARWFFGGDAVTKVIIDKRVITEVIPSSCVEVAPSLPPCRKMRELNIAASPTERIVPTDAALFLGDENAREGRWWGSGWSQPDPSQYPSNEENAVVPTPPPSQEGGWSFNGLFNGFYTTVTTTVVQEETQRFEDRAHVVTFSVVGCMPTRLPFDLDVCIADRADTASLEPSAPLQADAPSVDPRASLGAR